MQYRKNFRNMPIANIPVDAEYLECTFMQPDPIDIGGGVYRGHRLFPGDDTPRTFTDCNLINCELPPGSIVNGGNTGVQSSPQVVSTETVTLPDASQVTVEHHSIFIYGRYLPATESYEDFPTPQEVELD